MSPRIPVDRVLLYLVFGWGFCAFFPLGISYAFFLLLMMLIAMRGGIRQRFAHADLRMLWQPMVFFLAWAIIVAVAGPSFADSPTRLFHIFRVLLLLLVGMLLTPLEARFAFAGFLAGAVMAGLIIAVSHTTGLPEWDIWSSLLSSRNNKSSANMIMMAIASGGLFYLGLRNDSTGMGRWPAWIASLVLGVTVAVHGVSRNAQLLLPVMVTVAIICNFRSLKAVFLAAIAVVVISASAVYFSPSTQTRFLQGVAQAERIVSDGDYTTGVGERWRMFSQAWQGMVAHPLLGTGLGSWLPLWKPVALETAGRLDGDALLKHVEINNPHNDFLLAGMETGVPGMVATAWLLLAFVVRGWRDRSAMGDVAVMLAVGLIVIAMVNAPLRDAAMGMTLLWLLGVSIAGQRRGVGMGNDA
ncbi:MAG: O-antigen ligase family protein [Rhodoferax sp.]|jgi:O-antigen ligase|nr:O-antigen ligase family protein [Rhodoferax sp.]